MGKNINKFLDKNNLQEVVKNSYSKREILINYYIILLKVLLRILL